MGEDPIYSVNDVIASLDQFHDQTVRMACVLNVEFEGDSIWHTPTIERLPDYGSSLWADFDSEFRPRRLNGRHVVVTAIVDKQMHGHRGLWPGSVVVLSSAKGKEAFSNKFEAVASASQDLLDEYRAAPGESYQRRMQFSKRSAELNQIMQSPYGMEKLMQIWRDDYGIPDGQFPPRGVTPLSEILRKEFPDAE